MGTVTVDAKVIGDLHREIERAERVLFGLQQHAEKGAPPGGGEWSQDYRDGLSVAYQNALDELRSVRKAASRVAGW